MGTPLRWVEAGREPGAPDRSLLGVIVRGRKRFLPAGAALTPAPAPAPTGAAQNRFEAPLARFLAELLIRRADGVSLPWFYVCSPSGWE